MMIDKFNLMLSRCAAIVTALLTAAFLTVSKADVVISELTKAWLLFAAIQVWGLCLFMTLFLNLRLLKSKPRSVAPSRRLSGRR